MKDRKVLILTGTSSGIGHALAHKLTGSPYEVIITAREGSIKKLEEEFRPWKHCSLYPLDLTCPNSRQSFVKTIKEKYGRIDILVNNAGISFRSVVEHMSKEEEELQLETNYFGPMALIRNVLPYMRQQCSGKIINVSSVAGIMAMPTMGSYSASKFALEGASEALWYELKPWNISVSLIQIGFIHSESYKNVYWSKAAEHARDHDDEDYHIYYTCMSGFVEKLMKRSLATPEKIADGILRTVQKEHPPLRVPLTFDAHLFSWLRRLLPRSLYHWILYRNLPSIHDWERAAQRAMKPSTENHTP
ncbi:MAG: SDR family oxidoreductase [Bdellovibrionales bacterium]|nr:SDR family oxidoreductase [Bdellovibrionales bacterium]